MECFKHHAERNQGYREKIKAIRKETEVPWRKPRYRGKDPGDAEEKHPQPNFSKTAGSGKPSIHRALRMDTFPIQADQGNIQEDTGTLLSIGLAPVRERVGIVYEKPG